MQNLRYDIDDVPELQSDNIEDVAPPPKCEHVFEHDSDIITEYSTELCEKVIEYGRGGMLIEGFSGKFKVCTNAICRWLSLPKEYPEWDSAVKISVSACVHYWQEELHHAMDQTDWTAVQNIRMILADINKSMPKQLREGLFDNLQKPDPAIEANEKDKNVRENLKNAAIGLRPSEDS